MKKALIFDLDNTIYPVHSIGAVLFEALFEMIDASGEMADQRQAVRQEIMRKPFQVVAGEFGFSDELTYRGITHLQHLRYTGPIEPFPDFRLVRDLPHTKFLVTTGFTPLQDSKIDGMKIRPLFHEVHIVDPMQSSLTKKDVFADILARHAYANEEVLVIGDDPASEIKAALALALPVVMYDALGLHPDGAGVPRITDYQQLLPLLAHN